MEREGRRILLRSGLSRHQNRRVASSRPFEAGERRNPADRAAGKGPSQLRAREIHACLLRGGLTAAPLGGGRQKLRDTRLRHGAPEEIVGARRHRLDRPVEIVCVHENVEDPPGSRSFGSGEQSRIRHAGIGNDDVGIELGERLLDLMRAGKPPHRAAERGERPAQRIARTFVRVEEKDFHGGRGILHPRGQSRRGPRIPSEGQRRSTRSLTSADISIASGQGRRNPSSFHLRVASMPILLP